MYFFLQGLFKTAFWKKKLRFVIPLSKMELGIPHLPSSLYLAVTEVRALVSQRPIHKTQLYHLTVL